MCYAFQKSTNNFSCRETIVLYGTNYLIAQENRNNKGYSTIKLIICFLSPYNE